MAETTEGLKIGFDIQINALLFFSLFVISKSTLGGKADLDEGF